MSSKRRHSSDGRRTRTIFTIRTASGSRCSRMHGYVGLAIYVLLWWLTWRCASDIIRTCRTRADLRWAGDLAAMIQVALVGFWVGGTFLGLAYFDLPYILLALLVLTKRVVTAEVANTSAQLMPTSEPNTLSVGMVGHEK